MRRKLLADPLRLAAGLLKAHSCHGRIEKGVCQAIFARHAQQYACYVTLLMGGVVACGVGELAA